jgi:hypothetical protein
MKKQLSKIALGLTLLSYGGFAQQNFQLCNTYKAMDEYFAKNPEAKKSYEANQKLLNEQLNNNSMAKASSFQYTIPVVFHVLHAGGSENVTDAQIEAALISINKDFAAATPDYTTIAQPFQSRYINSDIKLVLATKDPAGNGTTGINHIYDARTDWAQGNTNNYNGITWNPTKYLNIITVRDIIENSPVSGGQVGGYTYKPGTWGTGASADAIVVLSTFISGSQVRGLTHEIGHWFNLSHTFGNTNNPGVSCGDDGIADTPPTKGNFSSCPSSASGNPCATSGTTVYAAGMMNTENIMDYSTCPKNFTTDQTTAMRNALASTVSNRQNLWQPANLSATGITNPNPPGSFPPKAEFLSSNFSYTVCAGGSLTMKDFSYNGVITTYNWSADNGATAAAPGSSNTTINFPTIGTTNVTLTVANNGGASTRVRTVTVLDGTADVNGTPYMESFENMGTPQGWNVINPNPGSSAWEQTWSAGLDGVGSFMIDGSLCGGDQVDILETPMFDLSAVNDPVMEFAVSYAMKNTAQSDALKVQASKDCGGTWQDIVPLGAIQMQANTGGITASSFTPAVSQEWKTYKLNDYSPFYSFLNSSNVRFRFTFIEDDAGYGNNIFIDAIKLTSTPTGLSAQAKDFSMKMFPNPTHGAASLQFNLNDPAEVNIDIRNLLGQQVLPVTSSSLPAGGHTVVLNGNNELSTGVYLVNISINGAAVTSRLIVN